jgi:hypothetical protein
MAEVFVAGPSLTADVCAAGTVPAYHQWVIDGCSPHNTLLGCFVRIHDLFLPSPTGKTCYMTRTFFHYRHILAVLCLFASFCGCQILEPPSKSFDQLLTNLEQCQLAFIDTYTAAPGKQWDDAKFRADISTGEAMFTNAIAAAQQKKLLIQQNYNFAKKGELLRA